MRLSTLLLLLPLAAASASAQEIDPRVTQANLKQTICKPGYTKTVRPSVAFTNKIKFALMKKQGIPLSDAKLYELDHWEPLELGGAPRSLKNLRLQPYAGAMGATTKDGLENLHHTYVCTGYETLKQAQDYFAKTAWDR